jgi:nucleoid-associated protein YgaU
LQIVVAERPDFPPAWVGLGELYLRQQRGDKVERAARQMEVDDGGPVEAAVFRPRSDLARPEFLRGHVEFSPATTAV